MSINTDTKVTLRIYRVKKDTGEKELIYEKKFDKKELVRNRLEQKLQNIDPQTCEQLMKTLQEVLDDPTWSVNECAANSVLVYISANNIIKTWSGYIKDSSGNTYNLTDVTGSITQGSTTTSRVVDIKGKITPSSNICMYEIFMGGKDSSGTYVVTINLVNESGSGNGVQLLSGNEYIIEVTENISCPSTVNVPAPDGTC